MRNLIFTLLILTLTGCCTPQSIVKIEHVLVAPDDNLLVDCDIEAPPSKDLYLKDYSIGTVMAKPALAYSDDVYLSQYTRALKNAEGREAALTKVMLRNYSNQDVCNRRLKKLREWKAASVKALSTDKPPGSK